MMPVVRISPGRLDAANYDAIASSAAIPNGSNGYKYDKSLVLGEIRPKPDQILVKVPKHVVTTSEGL